MSPDLSTQLLNEEQTNTIRNIVWSEIKIQTLSQWMIKKVAIYAS
jgi:hypothetical protein